MSSTHLQNEAAPPFLSGGGEAGATARAVDWAKTPVGPVDSWPASLRTMVGTLLHSRHPMFLWWGPELVQFYNDGYLPSFGRGKHPAAMGQRGADCWQEIWPIIWPQIEAVMTRAAPSWNEDQLVPIFRNGRIEEVYWTYGYSPVFEDDGSVGGTLVVCTETTRRVLGERRLRSLERLLDATALAADAPDLLAAARDVLSGIPNDAPFALIYTAGGASEPALRAAVGLSGAGLEAADARVRGALRGLQGELELELAPCACAPWPEPVCRAFVVPIPREQGPVDTFIAFGLSPRLPFDGDYRAYLRQFVEHLALPQARIEALHERLAIEAERRSLLLQAPVATALFRGPEHRFELANPLYCEMVGRNDLVGKTYREAFPELVDTPLPGILDRVYTTGVPFVTHELSTSIARGGRLAEASFRFNLEPIRDAEGRVYGMMAIAVEITEQVNARRVLEKAHAEREQLLVELQAASRAKDEFLAMLGHELRNPLAPIATAVKLMELRGDQSLVHERQIIDRQVRHLSRLVDDLLDVSRIAQGKIDLELKVVDLADVAAKALELASPLLEAKSHRLELDAPRGQLYVRGDPVRLAQVLGNLLTNAAKYTPARGRIELSVAREGTWNAVRVRDNGIGIAPEFLPRVFELFAQGRRALDRADGGLGLGLAVVKSLVGLHGGEVAAFSEGPGRGSEFRVRFPAAIAPTVGDAQERPARAAPRQSRRVLIVDDNTDAASMLAETLSFVGYDVAVAQDGPEALKLQARFRPHIGVLDIGLPVMDGYELAGRMRKEAGQPLHLVAVTGYGQREDRERSARAGFDAHLVKPVELDEIIALLARIPG